MEIEATLGKSAAVRDEQSIPGESTKEANQFYTIDQFLEQIGQVGRFQISVLLCLSAMLVVPAYQTLFMVFAFYAPPWICTGTNSHDCNSTTIFDYGVPGFDSRCHMNRSSWTYLDSLTSFSIVTEYDLVCSRKILSAVADSAHFIGIIIAGLPLAYISDIYGRKPVIVVSYIGLCLFSFLIGFSPNVGVVILFRVLTGGCICGMLMTIPVIALELVGPKYRTFAGTIYWNAWTLGMCLLSLQSWFVPQWKILAMITSAPYLLFSLAFFFLPESIRWYWSQNRTKEAESVLQKTAKINGKNYPWNRALSIIEDNDPSNSSYRVFVSSIKETIQTLSLCWMWFTNDLNYYGIAIASGDFGGAPHRDFVLFSICEIPGNLISIYVLDKIGRKRSTLVGYIATSLSLICFGCLQHFNVQLMALRVTLGIIAKMFNILAWNAVSIWSGELYPTNVRTQAIGLFVIASQCGSFCSPWIATWLKNYSVSLPFFIFGGFPFIAGFLAMRLKETSGISLDMECNSVTHVTTNQV